MSIQHHIDDATLMAYATGSLPEAFNLMVATHVSLCDTCRATVESYNALGGAMMERAVSADLSPDSLEHTLAGLDTPLVRSVRPAPARGALPRPVMDYVGGDLDSVRWRPVGMGVKQAILPTSSAASARLLLIPAGTAIPDHSHHGREMTMVLQGAFLDDADRFARGDVEIADDHVHHQPVADIGEDCICLAVTDAPLRFSGLIPRIVQKFVRI